jgi:ATP:cob(I)alamin adenosyltransferase
MTLAFFRKAAITCSNNNGGKILFRSNHRQFSAALMSDYDNDDNDDNDIVDIEDLHFQALKETSKTYIDPSTGFTVFTEYFHLRRGTCCGNSCRHCPYGFENVKNAPPRLPKLRSGDHETAERMVEAIEDGTFVTTFFSPPSILPPKQQEAISKSKHQQQQQRAFISTKPRVTMSKNVPYTRTGDGGSSQLGTGERRAKDDLTFEAMGTVDELCSIVGVVHASLDDTVDYGSLSELLLDVMSRLFDVGSHVAKPSEEFCPNGLGDGFDPSHIDDLESWINIMTNDMPELTSFILPTGATAAAHLHVARTVCRRAERRMVPLVRDEGTCDPNALKYLNRLSDFLFTAARYVNFCMQQKEIQYQRESSEMTQRQRVTRSLTDGSTSANDKESL